MTRLMLCAIALGMLAGCACRCECIGVTLSEQPMNDGSVQIIYQDVDVDPVFAPGTTCVIAGSNQSCQLEHKHGEFTVFIGGL